MVRGGAVKVELQAANPFPRVKSAMKVPAGFELVIEAADQGVDVTRLQERLTERDVFVIEGVPARQLHALVLREIVSRNAPASRVECAANRDGGHHLRVRVGKDRCPLGKPAQVRRFQVLQPLRAVARQVVGAKSVSDNYNQVQSISRLLGRSLPF